MSTPTNTATAIDSEKHTPPLGTCDEVDKVRKELIAAHENIKKSMRDYGMQGTLLLNKFADAYIYTFNMTLKARYSRTNTDVRVVSLSFASWQRLATFVHAIEDKTVLNMDTFDVAFDIIQYDPKKTSTDQIDYDGLSYFDDIEKSTEFFCKMFINTMKTCFRTLSFEMMVHNPVASGGSRQEVFAKVRSFTADYKNTINMIAEVREHGSLAERDIVNDVSEGLGAFKPHEQRYVPPCGLSVFLTAEKLKNKEPEPPSTPKRKAEDDPPLGPPPIPRKNFKKTRLSYISDNIEDL